ncbi:MAG: signal peptidase II, partial [Candidatus Izemoplasmatales bacterium]|nr:signal peptidase II [Candidatus Izemoplasmatales bacterium]
IIALALIGLDQASKIWISSILEVGESITIIPDFFYFTHVRNTGGVFGMAEGFAADYYWLFVLFAIIASSIFGYMLAKTDFLDKRLFILRLAMILLISGSIGNAIDRIAQTDHAVVDFIDFIGIWEYRFNLADTFLNVGIGLFFIDIFFLEKKRVVNNG